MAERKQARNVYFDHWAERFEFYNHMPYAPTSADWVQLDRLLTKSDKLSERMTLDVWKQAVENFFHSDVGTYSLTRLCSAAAFVAYWRGPLDRFGKPREKASQVGSAEPISYASWHPAFLKACWQVAQKNKAMLNAVAELMEVVGDMDEHTAFRKLKEIEDAKEYDNAKG